MTRRRRAWQSIPARPYPRVGSTLRGDTLAEIKTSRSITRRNQRIVNQLRNQRKATPPPTPR